MNRAFGKELGKEMGKEMGKEQSKYDMAVKGQEMRDGVLELVDRLLAKQIPNHVSLLHAADQVGQGFPREEWDPSLASHGAAQTLEACVEAYGPRRPPELLRRMKQLLASLGRLRVADLQEDGLLPWFSDAAGQTGSEDRSRALSLLIVLQKALRTAVKRRHPLPSALLRAMDRLALEYGLAGRKAMFLGASRTELRAVQEHLGLGEAEGVCDSPEA